MTAIDKTTLGFRQIDPGEGEQWARFAVLVDSVFAMKPVPAWPVMAFLDAAGRCVAGLQTCILRLVCDGALFPVAAIRNVAVAPDWRGHGLMHDLMARTLPWCDAQADLTLLYAETPSLYTRHGFVPLPQHAFEADAPEPIGPATARRLDARDDGVLIRNLLEERVPASCLCGVDEDGGMAEHRLVGGETWPLAYDAALGALIVHEMEDETLVLVDIVAARIPSAARILSALGARPQRLRTLFPPDRLGWKGQPVPEDAGLMARGTLPPVMRQPFILPPTFEF